MKAILSHAGKRVTISMDECPASTLGLWQTVRADVPQVSITPKLDNVKIEGPVAHALWAVWLWFELMRRHGRTLGYVVEEASVKRAIANLQEDIRSQRGF